MISIPSAASPAFLAVSKSPQPSAAPDSNDDPNSFANYLKSVAAHQSSEQSDDGSTSPKLTTGPRDTSDKDGKNGNDRKKALLADTTAVPLTVVPSAELKPFQLSLSLAKAKTEVKGSGQGSGQPAETADSAADPNVKSNALKESIADTEASAPVAFGANLSKVDVLRTDGTKAGEVKADGKAQNSKTDETRTKAEAAEAASEKSAAGIAKAAESQSSSGNGEHGHADSSHDDSPAPTGVAAKAATASAATQAAENLAAIHAAAPSSNQVPAATPAVVQNAYAHTQPASMEKAGPVAPAAAVLDPEPTPSVRPQNIDLKIAGADNSQVDVRISQRAGDVQVTVRTPDGDLAQSLRQHLPELSDRLSQSGVSGDLWQPQTAQAANTGSNDTDSRHPDDAQTQQQGQGQHPRGNSNHNGQQQQQNTPTWLNELNQADKESK